MASAAIAALSGPDAEFRKVEELRKAIETFLSQCRKPELLEPGEPAIPIRMQGSGPEIRVSGNLHLTPMGKWLCVEALGEEKVLSRRVTGVRSASASRLELITHKLGGKPGKLFLFDAFQPSNEGLGRKGRRQVFGEQFRRMLQREFSGWRIAELSTEAHLEESLSPAYPRALLARGKRGIAAIAAPPNSDVDGVLSFALIWLDYLRRRQNQAEREITELVVFLPEGRHRTTCLRLNYLHNARYRAFCYDAAGLASEVDLQDCGNVESAVQAPSPSHTPRTTPEALIEEQVRADVTALDCTLRPAPVHGQVCSFAAAERGIFDLLAIDYAGRLAVIELKASESIHLPLQALDYWIHVQYHLSRGALAAYFPGIAVRTEPPRLLLAAPALCHHPTNERIVRYFRPEITIERIGLAHNWSGPARVMFRYGRDSANV